jgi:ribonuclease-3
LGVTQLILSSGHNSSHNSYLGGNAFEALVGAIYLDRGYDACMRFMEKRILGQLINIDKVAYKEVNFKSKLIEWSQKNRVNIEFKLLEQKKDQDGSPTFNYQVMIEGIEGGKGSGYSKKESQQTASKLTLQRLRREPQYIDAVFAAKANRTKMEEEPVENVPDTETKDDFIIKQEPKPEKPDKTSVAPKGRPLVALPPSTQPSAVEKEIDDLDLDDITAAPKEETRESIIAAAEEAAFAQ